MPLQNRVTPFGEIVAIPQRGLLTGNRGIIHDPATKTLLKKRWSSKAWLICTCVYKNVRRDVMARRSWTELFFLDEATGLAAGHRPCFCCRRDEAERFRSAWMRGNGGDRPSAPAIDAILHRERLNHDFSDRMLSPSEVTNLPNGAMFASGASAYVVVEGLVSRWAEAGYVRATEPLTDLRLLTPPSSLRTLSRGYQPVLHPTASKPLWLD